MAQQGPGDEAAGACPKRALPEKGPADVAIGRAKQPADLDLGTLGEKLQADGAEGDDHQRGSEQGGEQCDGLAPKLEQRMQAFYPGRIELRTWATSGQPEKVRAVR